MKRTPAFLSANAVTDSERQILLDYLAQDDHRTDARPDVRSKHPRWNESGWPQHIIESAMTRVQVLVTWSKKSLFVKIALD
jgi:hypothetical protein